MSSNCVVVVWEVESVELKKFVPYSPSVSQHLERAHAKKLTQVFLGDSDASLNDFYVNLRTMKQCSENADSDNPMLNVRRQFYSPSSPPGKGIKWEFAGNLNNEWHQYDIEIQCLIEDAWSNGNQQFDISRSFSQMPYIIDFFNMIQTRKPSGPIKQIRRGTQAVYPLTKLPSAINQQSKAAVMANKLNQLPPNGTMSTSRASINSARRNPRAGNYLLHQQMLSTSAPKLNSFSDGTSQTGSTRSAPVQVHQNQYNTVTGNALPPSGKKSSKSPKPVKPGSSESTTTSPTNLARQILNNLNIFSHHHHSEKGESSSAFRKGFILSQSGSHKTSKKSFCKSSHGSTSMLDLETSSINSRRPSVDTISTYLSNGSKGSRGGSVRGKPSYGSVSDLLNCSLSSENDDVFLSSHSSLSSSMSMNMIIKGSIVGIDSSSEQISRFVSVVDPPQSQPCPICLNELHRDNSAKNPTVSLSRCQHLMHLNCLNELILSQKSDLQKVNYRKCFQNSDVNVIFIF